MDFHEGCAVCGAVDNVYGFAEAALFFAEAFVGGVSCAVGERDKSSCSSSASL